ncbi:hypothetical protein AB3S75_011900 [Citrus x aurantiifolia]
MNSMRFSLRKCCRFSSFSTSSSSLPWISPLEVIKANTPKADPPVETSDTCVDTRKRSKFISHGAAISLIKCEKEPQRALEIFNTVSEQKGFNHNNATYATILDKLARNKKFEAVDAVLRQMTYETCKFHEGIFLNLMKRFSNCSLHERVLEMFHKIHPITREKPSLKAISTCLNLLIESNQVDLAQNFLKYSNQHLRLKPNTCIFNILIKHHCKRGTLESAFEVLKEMKKSQMSYPNLITYSTLIDGLCKNGRFREAIELFEEMVSKDQILPDALTYNVLIDGFCRGGKVDRAKKIMEFMKNNGCNPNVFNYTTLMNGFCKEGKLQEAKEVFDEMKNFHLKPDTVGYTTLINCFCRAGGVDEALELLKEMKERGCKADIVTFNVILGGLCREGRIEEALGMLEKLWGFLPHYATSNELLVRLCKAGMAEDAAIALFGLVEMGFKPESDSWALLVELICRGRKLLFAFELLDELVIKESGTIQVP